MTQTVFANGVNPWVKAPPPPPKPKRPPGPPKKAAPRRAKQEQLHACLKLHPGLTPPELVPLVPDGELFRISSALRAMLNAKVPSVRREGVPGKYRYWAIGVAPTTKYRQILRYLKRYPRERGWTGRELAEKLGFALATTFSTVYLLERNEEVSSVQVKNKSTGRLEKHFKITEKGRLAAEKL